MDDPPGMALPICLGINAVGSLVTTAVVALLYTWGGGDGPLDGIVCGLIVGAAVVAVEELNRPTYEGSPWSLYLINSGYAVVGYGLAGLVYSLIAQRRLRVPHRRAYVACTRGRRRLAACLTTTPPAHR